MILSPDISPEVVKQLSPEEKIQLAAEIRAFIIESVSKTGGHLASNLGTVELCIALHSVFSTPEDKIVFDVGHQAYTHKLLTGRIGRFSALRCEGGISGFPRPSESEHDAFIGGHASNSISAALGIVKAMELKGDNHSVISVIGDGSLTGGEAYEGLNNGGKLHRNFIVIMNDNEMSISKSQGAIANYLTQMRSTTKYYDTKSKVKSILSKNVVGRELAKSVSGTKELVKFAIYQSNIFENLGYKYLGPVNGHSIDELIEVLTVAKRLDEPCIVHIKTKKGKGYFPAEQNSGAYHGIAKGKTAKQSNTFSDVFGRHLAKLAARDDKICAITAAMKYGTGLQYFSKLYPERFFDVGIAEEHALTFACGLASQGFVPVFAVYSTFLQRAYDQLIHDAAIENYHIVLGVDRAGIVGEDGETHQGMFDVGMLTSVPNVTVYSPCCAEQLKGSLEKALYTDKGIVAVRYPRGEIIPPEGCKNGDYSFTDNSSDTLIVTYGRITAGAAKIKKCNLLSLVKIWPVPDEAVKIACGYKRVFFFEEANKSGGIGEKLLMLMYEAGFRGEMKITAVENGFVGFGDAFDMLGKYNLSEDGMRRIIGL